MKEWIQIDSIVIPIHNKQMFHKVAGRLNLGGIDWIAGSIDLNKVDQIDKVKYIRVRKDHIDNPRMTYGTTNISDLCVYGNDFLVIQYGELPEDNIAQNFYSLLSTPTWQHKIRPYMYAINDEYEWTQVEEITVKHLIKFRIR